MPRKLPKGAINPDNSTEMNRLLIDVGPAFHDDVARLFLLAYQGSDPEFELEMLADYLKSLIRSKDVRRFRQAADTFAYVINRLKSGKPYNRTLHLVDRYEQKRGGRAATAELADHLRAAGIGVHSDPADFLSYVRRLRRQLGTSQHSGRPRSKRR